MVKDETRKLRSAEGDALDCFYVFGTIISSMEDLISSSNLYLLLWHNACKYAVNAGKKVGLTQY